MEVDQKASTAKNRKSLATSFRQAITIIQEKPKTKVVCKLETTLVFGRYK